MEGFADTAPDWEPTPHLSRQNGKISNEDPQKILPNKQASCPTPACAAAAGSPCRAPLLRNLHVFYLPDLRPDYKTCQNSERDFSL